MYGKATLASSSAGAALPFAASDNPLAMIVAALVLLFAAMALLKLVPKLRTQD